MDKINSREGSETITFDEAGEPYPRLALTERIPLIKKLFLALIIILTASLAFGLGRLTGGGEREPIRVEYDPSIQASAIGSLPNINTSTTNLGIEAVVGSSKGSKYHFSHCAGAKQISEANKIIFASPLEAQKAGYTLAGNCSPK